MTQTSYIMPLYYFDLQIINDQNWIQARVLFWQSSSEFFLIKTKMYA